MQPGTPEAMLAAIAQSGAPAWLGELQRNAARMGEMQASYAQKQTQLWTALLGGKHEAVIESAPGDQRFSAKAWAENPYYAYLKQSYLLASRYVEEMVESAELEPEAKERLRFAARQWIDAMCPANFPATN